MKRDKKLAAEKELPEVSTFWDGTPEEYEKRVEEIQERCQEKFLPVPTREWIIALDAFDRETPSTVFNDGKLQQIGYVVKEIQSTFVEFERCDRQDLFDLLRRMTGEGSTMPEGYLDRVFENYAAAERIGR